MNVLDLFSGIGGFSLGLERAGMRTVAFCEIEPYCRAVLAKHWPGVPCYGDVRELTAARLAADGINVDVICGGFPCQDISVAGKGAGLAGARSGLWSEYARLIGELRPRYVIVENVSALLGRGLGEVLRDLATIRYDAEWHCIPAAYVGAPHRRDRIWIVAYPDSSEREAYGAESFGSRPSPARNRGLAFDGPCMANAHNQRLEGRVSESVRERSGEWTAGSGGASVQHATNDAQDGKGIRRHEPSWDWRTEPSVGRVAHGVPSRVDRLKALGNAVVPQIPEIIGRAIMRCKS